MDTVRVRALSRCKWNGTDRDRRCCVDAQLRGKSMASRSADSTAHLDRSTRARSAWLEPNDDRLCARVVDGAAAIIRPAHAPQMPGKAPAGALRIGSRSGLRARIFAGQQRVLGWSSVARGARLAEWLVAATVALVLGVLIGFGGARVMPTGTTTALDSTGPQFRQLTFDKGTIRDARFTPDGRSIIYGAAWNDSAVEDLHGPRGHPLNRRDSLCRMRVSCRFRARASSRFRSATRMGAGWARARSLEPRYWVALHA